MQIIIEEKKNYLKIFSPLSKGIRILIFIGSFIPFMAPYKLIVQPQWNFQNFFFIAGMVFAVMAMGISAYGFYYAIFGPNSWMSFDKENDLFVYAEKSPLIRGRVHEYPIGDIKEIGIHRDEGDENGTTYSLKIIVADAQQWISNSSYNKEEIEQIRNQILRFLG